MSKTIKIDKAFKTKEFKIQPQFKKREKKAIRKANEKDDSGSEKEIDELQDLQNKIKRQPSLWRNEFRKHLETFKKLFLKFREDPSREDEETVKYIKFMTHICDVYRKDLSFVPTEFVSMLEQNYSTIHPNVRFELVQSLRMIRTKKLATAVDIIPLFFKLFRAEDKALRRYLFTCIVGDLKLLNKKSKASNVNKTLQNFVYNMIKDPQEIAAKQSLQVMIELYKRKIWNDDNTVNVIAEAGLQKSPKLCLLACKFFLLLNYENEVSGSDHEDSDIDDVKKQILNTKVGAKMSRKKKHGLEKTLKNMRRRKGRKDKVYFTPDFLPIDLLRCPQEYAERLFYRLRKSNEKLEIKLFMMKFIGRLIGRHKLIMFNFYPFISKYINPHQKELAEFLAMVAESTHINVPHEEVSPLIEKICENFVNERASPVSMTIAMNSIREIAARNPNAMNKEQLQYCIAYSKIKNKSVSMAIKGLINLFRDLRPELLEKKQLGKEDYIKLRKDGPETMVENTKLRTIEGLDLLREHEGLGENVNMIGHRLLTDEDFKLIKKLQIQKKTEEAKEQLKLDLSEYDIVDHRFAIHDQAQLQAAQEAEEAEGEFDADDESGEDGSDADDGEKPSKKVKISSKTQVHEIKDGDSEEEKTDVKKVATPIQIVGAPPVIRSDGIRYVPAVTEDEVDFDISVSSISDSDSDEYVSHNPHNFIDGVHLNTYKKSKYQKLAETYVSREEKQRLKKERARAHHDKKGKKEQANINDDAQEVEVYSPKLQIYLCTSQRPEIQAW
ncbi:unnamed protein product [Moneuplotes crassus]|uniref:Protein SDA1 n=1 Tax=Euplotes crassus TaxID=5936 RepID=A0AAD2D9P8_EUPCR|nr:unnamed protein product [Moneuplotes crassus]